MGKFKEQKAREHQKGFTFVEIILVLVIVGVLSAVIISRTGGRQDVIREQEQGAPQPSPPSATPAAYWAFEEGSGTAAQDISGYGNRGAISGADWRKEGIGNYALGFDGENDCVKVKHSDSLNITADITVEAWVKLSGSPTVLGHDMCVVDKYRGSNNAGYSLQVDSYYGKDTLGFYLGNNDKTTRLWSRTSLAVGMWYHVAGVYDGSQMKVYVNGKVENLMGYNGGIASYQDYLFILGEGQELPENTPVTSSQSYLFIGGSYWSDEAFLQGVIDEVRIYDRALSAEEISSHAAVEPK